MAGLTIDQSLAHIVTEQPGAARVLEDFGLDYCCGGGRRLADACAEAAVSSTVVIAALLTIDPQPPEDWTGMCPTALLAHLERTHHAYLKRELPRLEVLAVEVADAHGARHPELPELRAAVQALRGELEPHLLKEERALFPLIRELVAAQGDPASTPPHPASGPISVLIAEHTSTGALLAGIRALAEGFEPPPDGCARYRALYVGLADLEADTHLHIHKENNVLFPMVRALEAQSTRGPEGGG